MAVRECKNLRDKCLKNQTNKKTKQHFFLLGQEEKSLFGSWVASHVEQQEPKVYYHHQKA